MRLTAAYILDIMLREHQRQWGAFLSVEWLRLPKIRVL